MYGKQSNAETAGSFFTLHGRLNQYVQPYVTVLPRNKLQKFEELDRKVLSPFLFTWTYVRTECRFAA